MPGLPMILRDLESHRSRLQINVGRLNLKQPYHDILSNFPVVFCQTEEEPTRNSFNFFLKQKTLDNKYYNNIKNNKLKINIKE